MRTAEATARKLADLKAASGLETAPVTAIGTQLIGAVSHPTVTVDFGDGGIVLSRLVMGTAPIVGNVVLVASLVSGSKIVVGVIA